MRQEEPMATATLQLTLGEVYEPDAVADALKVGKGTVYRLIHSKKLFAVKVGSQYRIPAAAVYEYLGLDQAA
jgi:excisionase family DNA binding protein